MKWTLIWLQKEWISTPLHYKESTCKIFLVSERPSWVPFTLASKNLNLSRIRVFRWKIARQLPLNTKKKRIEKPTSAAWFFETPPKFHWFFANVNARSNLAGIIRVFGHVVRDLQRNHPTVARDIMRTTRVRSKVERSRACAPLTKTQVRDSGFFAHALFVPKTPNAMGFSWQCKRYNKKPRFLGILVFANVNGPMEEITHWQICIFPAHRHHSKVALAFKFS